MSSLSNPGSTLKKIMLVDDEEDITKSLEMGLSKLGFQVTTFNDPLVALSNFKPRFYDLVVSDVRMPNMSGLEFAYKLKKIDPHQRIVFLTAFMDVYTGLKGLLDRTYVVDVIQKPIGIADLAAKLLALQSKSYSAEELL